MFLLKTFITFFLFFTLKIYSQEHNKDEIVSKVIIKGLVKTKQEFVINTINFKDGSLLSDFNQQEIEDRLRKTNLFSSIEFNHYDENNYHVIEINLKEKASIVTLPYFRNSNGKDSYGAMFINSNFQGLGSTMVIGGSIGNESMSFIGIFSKKHIRNTNFSFSLVTLFSEDEISIRNNEKEVALFSGSLTTIIPTIGYEFNPNHSLRFSTGYAGFQLTDSDLNTYNEHKGYDSLLVVLGYDTNYETYNNFAFEGFSNSYSIRIAGTQYDGSRHNNISYRQDTSFSKFIANRIKVGTELTQYYSDDIYPIQNRTGPAFLVVDSGIYKFKNLITSRSYLEYFFYNNNFISLSSKNSWQSGAFKDGEVFEKYNSFYGYSTGINVYLKRITIPAVSFSFARNIRNKADIFKVSVGASF